MITTAALIIGGIVLRYSPVGHCGGRLCGGIQAEREEATGEMIARASGLAQPFNRPDSWHPDRRGDNRP